MKYFLDTADHYEYERWKNYICGVTTNPKLIEECFEISSTYTDLVRITVKKFPTLYDHVGYTSPFPIFVQIHNEKEYEELKDLTVFFKVPLIFPEGYALLRHIVNKANTCATMVYDLVQLNFAMDIGCSHSIVLVAKNDNPNFLEEAVALKENHGYRTSLIAASFRIKNDIIRAIKSGVDFVSVPPALMEEIFINEKTERDWRNLK